MTDISIIIPLHHDEREHILLLEFLEGLQDPNLEIIPSHGSSRANALNLGVQKAKNNFFWFVHADTKLDVKHIDKLKKACLDQPKKLHYFKLKFLDDGPVLSRLNGWGANIRSKFLKMPWGDQCFCCSKEIFEQLGPYDENAPYGEDHLFVWAAHQKKIKLSCIDETVKTSARQYTKKGWLYLTLIRQYLWVKQAIPQFYKLIKIRIGL